MVKISFLPKNIIWVAKQTVLEGVNASLDVSGKNVTLTTSELTHVPRLINNRYVNIPNQKIIHEMYFFLFLKELSYYTHIHTHLPLPCSQCSAI